MTFSMPYFDEVSVQLKRENDRDEQRVAEERGEQERVAREMMRLDGRPQEAKEC